MRTAKLTEAKYNALIRAQDVAYELMRHSQKIAYEFEEQVALVNGYEVDVERFHDIMSCIVGSIEELVEKYDCYFD